MVNGQKSSQMLWNHDLADGRVDIASLEGSVLAVMDGWHSPAGQVFGRAAVPRQRSKQARKPLDDVTGPGAE